MSWVKLGVSVVVAELYSKILKIRFTEEQYSAMALRAGAEGHSSISNWVRSNVVELLKKWSPPESVLVIKPLSADEPPPEPEATPIPVVVEEAPVPESNPEESAPEPETVPDDDSVPSVPETVPSLGGASSEEPDWATILGNVVDT